MWMWSRLAQLASRGRIQHKRVQVLWAALLGVRLLEGAACWAILYWFYAAPGDPAWALHLTFGAYAAGNAAISGVHRRGALTAGSAWLDVAINVLPMALAAHWSGGLYSPFVPLFVVKIVTYTVVYGGDIGWQSFVATVLAAVALVASAGDGTMASAARYRQLSLAFEVLAYGIIIGGALKFFPILQDRERRLAVIAREKEQLYQQSLRQQAHLRRLSQRMMRVSERTMRRLAHELHDDLGQVLTAVKMDLGLIERQLGDRDEIRGRVHEARQQIGGVLQEVRNLSQLLRPAVLDDLGLVPAIESFIARFRERSAIAVALDAPAPGTRLPRSVEVTLYRVLQEGLTNVARHAEAHHVHVSLRVDDVVTLNISDDGRGFDAAAFLQRPPLGHGMGVIGMRERIASYGGQFVIESREGNGTSLRLSIPLAGAADDAEDENGEDPRLAH
jgi:signal transduction histidine kinase